MLSPGDFVSVDCTLDLGRTRVTVAIDTVDWSVEGVRYPYLERCKERTVYHWTGAAFEPVARFAGSPAAESSATRSRLICRFG